MLLNFHATIHSYIRGEKKDGIVSKDFCRVTQIVVPSPCCGLLMMTADLALCPMAFVFGLVHRLALRERVSFHAR